MVRRQKSSLVVEDVVNIKQEMKKLKKENITLTKKLAASETRANLMEQERNNIHEEKIALLNENDNLRLQVREVCKMVLTSLLKASEVVTNLIPYNLIIPNICGEN